MTTPHLSTNDPFYLGGNLRLYRTSTPAQIAATTVGLVEGWFEHWCRYQRTPWGCPHAPEAAEWSRQCAEAGMAWPPEDVPVETFAPPG